MDSLEEQLVKLSIINSRPLSPRINAPQSAGKPECGKVALLVNSLQENSLSLERSAKQIREGGACRKYATTSPISPKKVGPIVPPKPHKKKSNFPEVPQSSLVKQACEPLFSQRLQCLDSGATKLNVVVAGRPSLLQRKQPIYATKSGLYDKTSKVTLDNPAVLEQQLEALAHHKKQLEKKGLLQQHQEQSSQSQLGSISCIPKLSSTSLINDIRPNDHAGAIYPNIRPTGNSTKSSGEITTGNCRNVYGNVSTAAENNIYSNVFYAKESLDDMPLPPPAVLSITTVEAGDYLHNANELGDEIPPPPSPVSSSYSELRRATDVFSKKPPAMQQQENADAACSTNRYAHYVENGAGSGAIGIGGSAEKSKGQPNRQTYMNMHYSNEYSSYSPTLQSISQDSSDYYGYGSFSQGSSTYESIYEPINPRPPSQLSSRSNYLMYAPYVNGPQITESGGPMLTNSSSSNLSTLGAINSSGSNTPLYPSGCSADVSKPGNHQKEAEVEVLTDFLVHSMDTNNDVDNFGICFKCNERVLGENSGCTAMDQIYHIACFTCCQCQINLQGKPFYALEGKPYCEFDYLQTLEKCSVCMKPILERILRATGKPYHPQCFTCIVCGNSLDGIPFTVDATNQNYCIADFHKKFAPRCCVCKEPIMPEPGEEETVRVVALDRSFHFECYKCEDCGLLLSSEAEGRGCYPLDDHVLCKSCNAKRVQMLTNRMTTEL